MALSNAYITVEDLTGHLSSLGDATGDTLTYLEHAINAASRTIDQHCRRRFYADSTASARRFYPEAWDLVYVPDISTTTDLEVKTDTTNDGTFAQTWSSSEYELEPLDGISSSGEAWPYTTIRAVDARQFLPGWSRYRRRPPVQVTAIWGWPGGAPANVVQACLILSARLYRRRQSPEGVLTEFSEFGPVRLSRQDNDVMALLAPYCKVGVLR
jgi:hypothetical protein